MRIPGLKYQLGFLGLAAITMVLLMTSSQNNDHQVSEYNYKRSEYRETSLDVKKRELHTDNNPSLCGKSSQDLGLPESIPSSDCQPNCNMMKCKNVLYRNNTKKQYENVRKWLETHKRKTELTNSDYIQLLKDCDKFKSSRGYPQHHLSEEELHFPIAFNILVHKDVEHVERLLRSIYFPQNVYCIHIDKKQPGIFKDAIRSLARCFNNVFIPSQTERIVYAGFSRLKADINCMKDFVKMPKTRWKYLLNVAGQSMPLKSNLEMVRILKIYNGANDIEGMYKFRVLHGRLDNQWKEMDNNRTNTGMKKTGRKNPPPPHSIDIVRGSAYGVFSRAFVEWLLTNKMAQDLLEWSKTTFSPDEHYWSTLHHTYSNPHLHPPGGYKGIPQEKPWLAVWVAWAGLAGCHGKWARGICVMGVADISSLVSRKEFFVNKFHMDYQHLGLDCLEMWIRHKNNCPESYNLDMEYYHKLPFIIPQDSNSK